MDYFPRSRIWMKNLDEEPKNLRKVIKKLVKKQSSGSGYFRYMII